MIGTLLAQLLAMVAMGVSVYALPIILTILSPIVNIVAVLIGCFKAGKTKVNNSQLLTKMISNLRSPSKPVDTTNSDNTLDGLFRKSSIDRLTFHNRQELTDFLDTSTSQGFYSSITFDERTCQYHGCKGVTNKDILNILREFPMVNKLTLNTCNTVTNELFTTMNDPPSNFPNIK